MKSRAFFLTAICEQDDSDATKDSPMLIEVRKDSKIKGSEQSSAQVMAVVHAALDRYGDSIRRVDVHLSDAIGHKAGHDDKCCMIEARRDDCEPIVVTHQENTIEQAIHGAIHKLKKAIESAVGKRPPGTSPGSSLGMSTGSDEKPVQG